MAETIQQFETGATRNASGDKFDYEAFINPEVLHAYGEFMHSHRLQKDGSLRDGDNWQKGIPFAAYAKSLVRHSIDLWRMHRGYRVINPDTGLPHTIEELCCSIIFNAMGYLKERLDPSRINALPGAVVTDPAPAEPLELCNCEICVEARNRRASMIFVTIPPTSAPGNLNSAKAGMKL